MTPFRLKGASGVVMNESWNLQGRSVIGRAPDCDIQVESEGLAERHAELIITDSGIALSLLETGGSLFVNGQAVNEVRLASGDEIRIADCRWVLQAPGLKPEKVLTSEAVRKRTTMIPWLIVGGLLAVGALAWWSGYLPF